MKIIFCGDTTLNTNNRLLPSEMERYINDADIFVFNCETVIADSELLFCSEKRWSLKTVQDEVIFLKRIGNRKIANLANNHAYDYGDLGLKQTTTFFEQNGVDVIGIDKLCKLIEISNKKIAFIAGTKSGANARICKIVENDILGLIKKIRTKADFVVVNLHWGIEYSYYPYSNDVKFARKCIDSGADLIIGHHPHVIQVHEIYRGKYILYSLGNFNFSLSETDFRGSNIGMVCEVTIDRNNDHDIKTKYVRIDSDGVPSFFESEALAAEMNKIYYFFERYYNSLVYSIGFYVFISRIFMEDNLKSWYFRIKRYGLRHCLQMIRAFISPLYIKMFLGYVAGGFLFKKNQ